MEALHCLIAKLSIFEVYDCLQYYSSFAVKYNPDKTSWSPEGLVVGIISNKNPLFTFGYILGPSLAAGYKILLQTDPQLSLVASLLIDLAVEVGIPEGTIRLIPGNVDPSVYFTNQHVSVISIFDDLHKEKYFVGNNSGKHQLLNFYSSGIPMIVFDNCDLDSACHSVVDSVWGYRGLLPWSVKNILIQETVFDIFVRKLKQTVDKILVGCADGKNIDVSFPSRKTLDKLKEVVEKAKSVLEVYQPNSHNVIPTLLIGGNIFHNNVIKEDSDVPIVTCTAFRTVNEAVALANNTRQGLAASVWSESTTLINEIVRKLKVTNIWVNSHGLFSADISLSPYKCSGNAYFGGKEGFYEYVNFHKNLKDDILPKMQNTEVMEKAINISKKAQSLWCKLPRFDRVKKMVLISQQITTNKNTWSLSEKWLDEWVVLVHQYNLEDRGESFNVVNGSNVLSLREPCGVMAIETLDLETYNIKLIVAALIEGNSVIILNDAKVLTGFYSSVAKLLPEGVLIVLPLTQDAVKVAALHKELNVYCGQRGKTVFGSLPLKSSSKFKLVKSDNWDEARDQVTLIKNVWCNSGQSFM